jgi:hypothetical protein
LSDSTHVWDYSNFCSRFVGGQFDVELVGGYVFGLGILEALDSLEDLVELLVALESLEVGYDDEFLFRSAEGDV